jgi:signal transduction histidine kinase
VNLALPRTLLGSLRQAEARGRRRVLGVPVAAVTALIAAGLVLWLIAAAIVTVLLVRERTEALDRARRASQALALVLEGHAARTFKTIDVTLAGVAESIHLLPGLQPHERNFRKAMTARLEDLYPYVRAIAVVGPEGRIRHHTDYPHAPDISLTDRPFFERHRGEPGLERGVSPPLESRAGLGWSLVVSRRLGDENAFEGVALAIVQPQYFEAVYRRLGLGEADVIALYHRDGTVIASHPPIFQTGRSFAGAALFAEHLPGGEVGSYMARGGLFPYERLVTYRAVDGAPLVIALSQKTETILAAWTHTAIGSAIAMAGLLLLLALLIHQILRRLQLRERARERQQQAEKLEALGHLTGGIAHDFNNLLVVLASSLPLIRHPELDERQREDALGAAERAISRGADLVRQLTAFARRRPMRVEPVDLNRLLDGCLPMLRFAVGGRVVISAQFGRGVAPCLVDQSELEVALVNILVNAKHAMKGRGHVQIKTYDCAEDRKQGRHGQRLLDYVCLTVRDGGSGMPEAVRQRAFEPYFSTKGEAGTGLGLSQVYGFMSQIGGEVHIESELGRGTEVHLLFRKAPA